MVQTDVATVSQSWRALEAADVYDSKRKQRIKQTVCVQHDITSSSFPVMKSDYSSSPAKRNNTHALRWNTYWGDERVNLDHIIWQSGVLYLYPDLMVSAKG